MALKNLLEEHGGIIVRFEAIAEISEALEDKYGKDAESILYESAKAAGSRSVARRLASARNRNEVLRILSAYKESQNWGVIIFKKIDWDALNGSILVNNPFETRGKRSGKSSCPLLRGYLSGFLSKLLEEEILVLEDKSSRGAPNTAEFIFHPKGKELHH